MWRDHCFLLQGLAIPNTYILKLKVTSFEARTTYNLALSLESHQQINPPTNVTKCDASTLY